MGVVLSGSRNPFWKGGRTKSPRPSAPTWDFTNKRLQGIPPRDTPEQQAEKERQIQEYMARKKGRLA